MIARQFLRRLGLVAGLLLLAALTGAVSDRKVVAQVVKPKPLTLAQQKHLKEWADLIPRVNALLQKGKRVEAVVLLEQKVALDRKLFGGVHEEVDKSLSLLGRVGELVEDIPTARKARRAILVLRTELYGLENWRVCDARLDLKHVNLLAGLDADSRRQLREADQLRRKAIQLWRQGKSRQAIPRAQEALDILRCILGETHPHCATALNDLASLYQAVGAYDKALLLFEQARDLYRQLMTENHPHYATSLNNLASLYRAAGAYEKALALHEQARALRKKLLTDNHADYVASLNNLALVHQALGAYEKALPLLEQTRDRYRQLLTENHPHYATSLNNLAMLYVDMGAYDKALPLYEEALGLCKKLLTEDHTDYATSLDNLAALYRALRAYEKALPLARKARDLRKRLLTEKHPAYATSLHNLAELYQAMGAYEKALRLFEQARGLDRELLTENHPDYASSLNGLARLYQELGAYEKALPLFEQARDLCKKFLTENHTRYAISLNNLAMLHQAMGHTGQAKELLQQASRISLTFLDHTFTAQSNHERLNSFARAIRSLHHYASVAAQHEAPNTLLYEHALRWKGTVTSRQAETLLAHDQPDLRPRLQQLALLRAGLARLAHAVPGTAEGMASWRKQFAELDANKGKLEVELAQKSATFRELRRLRQTTSQDVAKALPAGTALLDFFQYDHGTPPPKGKRQWSVQARLLAFVLIPGRDPVCVPLGPAEIVDKAVQSWRQAVTTYRAPDQAGAALARLVWAPLRKHLAGVHTVLIAPDGVLCGLPFAALPGTKPGSFLLEELMIGYVTSGRHLLELELDARYPRGRGLLAVGDLDFGPPEKTRPALPIFAPRIWKALPGTRPEVEKVVGGFHKTFPDQATHFLRGKDASAAAFRQQLPPTLKAPRWRYLHLATHGYFEPPRSRPKGELAAAGRMDFGAQREARTYGRNPLLRARLVLARANADPDGGYLTALEVSGLDLRGVELAVLSACDTGLGRVEGGEGVQSLQRGFQMAGAQALVVSQWSVHDAATSVLMEEFYANLWQRRMPKLKALIEAQRTVLRSPARVLARQKELRAALLKRGVSEEMLTERSLGQRAGELPGGGRVEAGGRSPVAWWAAFVLSGDPR